jgi:hypothetical protein
VIENCEIIWWKRKERGGESSIWQVKRTSSFNSQKLEIVDQDSRVEEKVVFYLDLTPIRVKMLRLSASKKRLEQILRSVLGSSKKTVERMLQNIPPQHLSSYQR